MHKSSKGTSWADLRKEIFTPKEIAESDLRVALISEIVEARQVEKAKED